MASPPFRNKSNGDNPASPVTMSQPAGVVTGDGLLLVIHMASANTAFVGPGAPWVLLGTATGTSSVTRYYACRRGPAPPPLGYSFTGAGWNEWSMFAWAAQLAPNDAWIESFLIPAAVDSVNVDPPALSTVRDDATVVAVYNSWWGWTVNPAPAGYTTLHFVSGDNTYVASKNVATGGTSEDPPSAAPGGSATVSTATFVIASMGPATDFSPIGAPIGLFDGPWMDDLPLLFQDYGGAPTTGPTNTQLDPAAATMTFTGQTAPLDNGLNPANATMTFTGQTSPLNSTLVPAAASMVFTAQTATLASVINPANATMVFTGQTAREDTVLNPANATMVFTGQTGTVNVGALLTPAAASMTFTGQATALAVSINPAAGTMIFTGQTATLAHVLNPAPATMIFTGQGPRLDSVLMPVNATMVFTGQATRLDTVLNPTPASVSFTGQTPTVTAGGDILLNPAAASMVFTGQLATVSVASPPGGSFQLIFLKESGQMAKRIDAAGRMYEELGG